MHANAQTNYSNDSDQETLIIHRFSSIPPKPASYLWNPLIPRGKITLLAADPGAGKTTFALTLAAHLSRGEPLPSSPSVPQCLSASVPSPAATLLLSPEDDPNDTLHPRLLAANANLEHIHFLENLHSLIPQKPRTTDHGPRATPLDKLHAVIDDIPNLALLVIDPITHYLGLSDRLAPPSPDDPDSPRSILHQLAQLARDRHIAILLTTRLTKRIDPTLPPHSLQKILGPLSFPAIARSVLLLSPLPHITPGESPGTCATCTPNPTDHPTSPHRSPRVSEGSSPSQTPGTPPAHAAKQPPDQTEPPIKNQESKIENPLPSPTHLLIPIKLSTSALPAPIPFTLTNKITFHPNAPSQFQPPPKTPDPTLQFAIHFLETTLSNGPTRSTKVAQDAAENSISRATLARARESLGIQALKQAWSNRWFWQLPHESRPLPEDPLEKQFFEAAKSLVSSLQNDGPEDLDDDSTLDQQEEQDLEDLEEDPTIEEEWRSHESLPGKTASSSLTHESLPSETPCFAKNHESLPSQTQFPQSPPSATARGNPPSQSPQPLDQPQPPIKNRKSKIENPKPENPPHPECADPLIPNSPHPTPPITDNPPIPQTPLATPTHAELQ